MKKLVTAISCSLLLASSAAIAADVPVTKPASPRLAASSWTGFYAGVIGGYGWNTFIDKGSTTTLTQVDDDGNEVTETVQLPGSTLKANGTVFGAQIGADYELPNHIVVGIAGDYLRGNGKVTGEITGIDFEVRSIWTARGRVGLAFDSVLIYGTVGFAAAKSSFGFSAVGFSDETDASRKGWVAGLGTEVRFAGNWRLGAEYRYLSLGTEAVDLSASVGTTTIANTMPVKWRAHQALVSLNYQF
jgi:outer membrane immunogenic protein